MEALRVWVPTAFDFSDAAPVNVCWISILFVACDDATFAAYALGHVEVKAILFAKLEGTLRNSQSLVCSEGSAARGFALRTGPWRENEGRALVLGSL